VHQTQTAHSGRRASTPSSGWKLLAHHLYTAALDLVFPPVCVGCNRVGVLLCTECISGFSASIPETGDNPLVSPLLGLTALGTFSGALQKAVHALKYEGITTLAEPLGQLIAHQIKQKQWPRSVIVPVPLHENRRAARGYNQSALLGQVIASQLGWDYRDLLIRARETQSQVGLDHRGRQENVRKAFAACDVTGLAASHVILVDDVYTTGATIRECAMTLMDAGVKSIRAVVVGQAGFASTG
jgi:ComF family protein